MASLTAVDFDPFTVASGAAQPEQAVSAAAPKLTPVDFDPFTKEAQTAPAEAAQPPGADVPLPPPRPPEFGGSTGPVPPQPADVPLPPPRPQMFGEVAPLDDVPARGTLAPDLNLPPRVQERVDRDINKQISAQAAPGGAAPVSGLNIPTWIQNPYPAFDEQRFRTGGTVLDAVLGTKTGMNSVTEAYKGKQEKVAQAQDDVTKAEADLADIKRKMNPGPNASEADLIASAQMRAAARQMRRNPVVEASKRVAYARAALAKAKEKAPSTQKIWRDYLERFPSTLVTQGIDTAAGGTRIIMGLAEGFGRLTGAPDATLAARRAATDKIFAPARMKVAQWFKSDPTRDDELGSQLVAAVASTAGFAATGAAGRVLRLSPMAVTAIAGALPQAEQNWRLAQKKADVDPTIKEWHKWAMFVAGAGSGATEALPIGHMFERLEHISGGKFKRYLGAILASAGEEGVQEYLQQVINNGAEKGFLGSDIKLTKDAANNFLIGSMSGAIITAILGARRVSKMQHTPAGIERDIAGAAGVGPAAPLSGEVLPPDHPNGPTPSPAGAAALNPLTIDGTIVEPAPAGAPALLTYVPAAERPAEALAAPAEATPAEPRPTVTPVEHDPFAGLPDEERPTTPAATEEAPKLPETAETRILRASGMTDDEIASMSPAEYAATVREAEAAGVRDPGPAPAAPKSEAPAAPPAQNAGTRAAPVKVESEADLAKARPIVNVEPTEAQKAAGNYQMLHVKMDGLEISIETPKGEMRSGTDNDGTPWQVQMPGDYGYIKRTTGKDGDKVDVMIGPAGPTGKVFVVDQYDPKTGRFDEHKAIMGVNTADEARALYTAAYNDGNAGARLGGIREMSVNDFKQRILNGPLTRPMTGQKPAPQQAPAGQMTAPQTAHAAEQTVRDALRAAGVTDDLMDDEALAAAAFEVFHEGKDPVLAYQEAVEAILKRDAKVQKENGRAEGTGEAQQPEPVGAPASAPERGNQTGNEPGQEGARPAGEGALSANGAVAGSDEGRQPGTANGGPELSEGSGRSGPEVTDSDLEAMFDSSLAANTAPGERSADVQAGDSDETVRVTLKRKGPWDFNDTFPDVDPEHIRRLDAEGRNPFRTEGIPTVEEVVYTLNESLDELANYDFVRVELQKKLDAVKSGKTKYSGEKRDAEIKRLSTDIAYSRRAITEVAGTYADFMGREAAAAMVREARRMARDERETSPQSTIVASEETKPKPTTPAKSTKSNSTKGVERYKWADAQPGDLLEDGKSQLVQKGIVRKKDATELAAKIDGAIVVQDRNKWAVTKKPYDPNFDPPQVENPKRNVKPAESGPMSLVAFLRKKGGIKESGGELRARDLHRRHPGLVNNKRGLELDEARELAAEAGYLRPHEVPDGMSYAEAAMHNTVINDLLNAIDAHPTYSVADEATVAEREGEKAKAASDERYQDEHAGMVEEIVNGLSEYGMEKDDNMVNAAADLMMADPNLTWGAAYEAAVMHAWREDEDRIAEEKPNEPDIEWDIPFDTIEADSKGANADVHSPVEASSEAQGRRPKEGEAGAVGREGTDGDRAGANEARPLTEEAGAEGKPQLVIPGAEQIGQGQHAQMLSDKPLKGKGPQKEAGGLFGDSMNQSDLLDAIPAKPQESNEDIGAMFDKAFEENAAPSTPVASWMIRDKATGKAIMETFDKKKVDALNTEKYEAVPIQQHLAELNAEIKKPKKTKRSTPERIAMTQGEIAKVIEKNFGRSAEIAFDDIAPYLAGEISKEEARKNLIETVKEEVAPLRADIRRQRRETALKMFQAVVDHAELYDRAVEAVNNDLPAGYTATSDDGKVRIGKTHIESEQELANYIDNVTKIESEQELANYIDNVTKQEDDRKKKVFAEMNAETLRKANAIIDAIKSGRTVTLATQWRATRISNADDLKIGSDGLYVRSGKNWNYLFSGQVDQLYQQIAPKSSQNAAGGAADLGASAIKNAAMGLDDVTKGLAELFGAKPGKMHSGLSFDEEQYKAAVPLFKSGLAHFKQAGRDLAAMMNALVKHLLASLPAETVQRMKPYVVRFLADVRDGRITLDEDQNNAPGSPGGLESDRGAATTPNGLGEADIPAAGGRNGEGAGTRGRAPGRGRGGRGLSEGHAPVVGADGNLELPERKPEPATGPAEHSGPDGSGEDRGEGLPTDRSGEDEAVPDAQERAGLDERKRQQAAVPARSPIQHADPADIARTLPMLFPEQQDDVRRAEERYLAGKEPGFLLTNGTGTGKTFSGLGVIARHVMEGKDNIIVLAPSQPILSDWQRAASLFGINLGVLENMQSSGTGVVATTYANFGQNRHLVDRDWDLVVADEAHKLTQGQHGDVTSALSTLRAITMHPDGKFDRAQHKFRDLQDKIDAAPVGSKLRHDLYTEFLAKKKELEAQEAGKPRSNVLFMSATPFAYHQSLDYANGYLFGYSEGQRGQTGYNQGSGRDRFFIENLGYRMRYNKLTKPDAEVDVGIMERALHERLKAEGAVWGRALEVEKDYDRKFALIEDMFGKQIDAAMNFLSEADDGKFRPIWGLVNKNFDYLSRMRLLEAIKARSAVPYIRKQIALGRKVVVFHDYIEGGGFNPFDLVIDPSEEVTIWGGNGTTIKYKPYELYQEFLARNPQVKQLKFADYHPPIVEMTRNFQNVLLFNGGVSKKKREEAKRLFNEDGSGHDIIVVQSNAGEAGISLHDITNVHQRVLLNLGMPIRPTTAIQQEGRIYRVGQASDALFRYMNTGTNWERWTFAGKIAERAGTAENLALGNQARTIRQSFIDAFEASDIDEPGMEGEGTGGKEIDRAYSEALTEFQKAKTHYFANQKLKGKRDSRQGIDYYPTPEPLGLKMVEWADVRKNERVLEPSAGHGAIARYFPEDTHRTLVEPSNDLASRAALKAPGARVVVDRFENLHITNKYDAIVMNPPFGTGGKTAIDHLKKAIDHLANGGRIVALLPLGQGAKRFEDLVDSDLWLRNGLVLRATIDLPSVTFERAGTTINAFVAVIEKQTDAAVRNEIGPPRHRELTGAENIGELFDRLEHMQFESRAVPLTKEPAYSDDKPTAPVEPEKDASVISGHLMRLGQTVHAKTGEDLYTATLAKRVDPAQFKIFNMTAKKFGGWFSPYNARGAIPGFQFKSHEARDNFMTATGSIVSEDTSKPAASMPAPKNVPAALSEHARVIGLDYNHIANIVEDIIHRVAGSDTKFRIARSLRIPSSANPGASVGGLQGNAEGLYYILQNYIEIAMDSLDPRNSSHHEAFHKLQDYGLFTDNEVNVMRAEAPRLRQILTTYYGNAALNFSQLEAEAGVYGYYASARDAGNPSPWASTPLRRALERAYQFFRRIRNLMRGFGFQTSEDIFERARTGETKNSPDGNSRFYSSDNVAPNVATMPRRLAPNDRTRTSEFVAATADSFTRIRELQAKLTQDAGLASVPDVHAAVGAINTRISERSDTMVRDEMEPALKLVAEAGGTERVHRFMYVRHAAERNAYVASINQNRPDGGSGISTADARNELAAFNASPDIFELTAAADALSQVIDDDLSERVAAGLMTQQYADDLRNMYQNYVPLRGTEGDRFVDEPALTGAGFSLRGGEVMHVTGRSTLADDIVSQIFHMRMTGIVRAQKNRVDRRLLQLANIMEAHYGTQNSPMIVRRTLPMIEQSKPGPNGRRIVTRVVDHQYPNRPDVLTVKVGGKPIYIEFRRENQLADAFKNNLFSDVIYKDPILRGLSATTMFYARLRTAWNPFFAPKNFMRDIEDAFLASSVVLRGRVNRGSGGTAFLRQIGPSMVESFNYIARGKTTPEFEQFRHDGGKMSWSKLRTLDDIKKEIDRRVNGENPAMATLRTFRHVIEGWNDILENTTRYAMYRAAIRAGLSRDEATKLSLEGTLNFHRRGYSSAIQLARIALPFINPSIQSPLRAARIIDEAGGGARAAVTASKIGRGFLKSYAALVPLGFILSAWNYWAGGDDDDKVKWWDKARANWRDDKNFVIYTGTKDEKGRPNAIVIPAFPEVMFPYKIGANMAAAIFGNRNAWDISKDMAKAAYDLSPTQGRGVVPIIIQPFMDVSSNKTWTGAPIHPTVYPNQRGIPKSEIAWPSTPEAWKQIARGLNLVGLNLHPEDVRYFVSELSGGLYSPTAWALGQGGIGGGDSRLPPVAKDFYARGGELHSTYDSQKFKDAADAAALKRFQIMQKYDAPDGTKRERQAARRKNAEAIKADGGMIGPRGGIETPSTEIFDTGRKVLSDLYKQMSEAQKKGDMPTVDRLRNEATQVRKRYRQMDSDVRSGKVDFNSLRGDLARTRALLRRGQHAGGIAQ